MRKRRCSNGRTCKVLPIVRQKTSGMPPSLLLEEQFPDEESPFAAEGSAGHAMAEYLINKYLKKRTKRPVSDYYSDELLEAVDDYVEYNITQIEQARKDCDEPFIGVELKVSLAHRIEGCFGTADMVVVDSHKIHIIDLKLGKGVMSMRKEMSSL